MATLSENRIQDALDKACKVGLVEERFTVMGCDVVIRNLTPDEYRDVAEETRELKDVDFAYAFQMGHICRAIVEINGVDLRDVDYIESTVPDPKNPGGKKTVNLERHTWLRNKVLGSWGKEALTTVYRKFSDVIDVAEKQSVDGVKFVLPDETPEDIFRRLVGELKALEDNLPEDLVVKILEENGYGHGITPAELEAAQNALGGTSGFKKEPEEPTLDPDVREALRTPEGRDNLAEAVRPASPNVPGSEALRQDPREIMRRRQPLNQAAAQQPIPTPQQPPQPIPGAIPVVTAKSRAYAELEAEAACLNGGVDAVLPGRPNEVPELSRPMDRTPQQVVIDSPPIAGINPRFRPPPRP
jgi:hypothetical protein